jgi:endogenous inhibitor of DNA gyrase (YacG/DUF329 family)
MNCPNCGKPAEWKDNPARPFCSERCKLIDFGRWANEEYRVPVNETPLSEADEATATAPATPSSDGSDNQR